MTSLSEKDFQQIIVDLARLQGWWVHHSRPAQNRRGQWATPIQGDPGFPDLVMARAGRLIFAELKSEKGKLTAEQRGWLFVLASLSTTTQFVEATVEAFGMHKHLCERYPVGRDIVRVYLWRPSDWPEIERTLRRD